MPLVIYAQEGDDGSELRPGAQRIRLGFDSTLVWGSLELEPRSAGLGKEGKWGKGQKEGEGDR